MTSVQTGSAPTRAYGGSTRAAHGGVLRRIPLGLLLAIGVVLLAISTIYSIGVGAVSIPPHDVVAAIGRSITGHAGTGPNDFNVVQLQLPRTLER